MDNKFSNVQLTKEYKEHLIFDELEQYINFYNHLAFNVFSWLGIGTSSPFNFNTYVYSSIASTLKSIKMLLELGHLNDVFTLTRGYRDSCITNIYFLIEIDKIRNSEQLVVEMIDNWIHDRVRLPNYTAMLKAIEKYDKLKEINRCLRPTEGYYEKLSERLNDHAHYNKFIHMMYNHNELFDTNKYRENQLKQLSIDIRNIFIQHFIWLFTINDHYMMASDYIDYLDCGLTPPENAQYWVSPLVQEAFDNTIKKYRSDLAEIMKNSTCMELV